MNPCDALQQDWRMYYNGSWMRHKTKGPGQVLVSPDNELIMSFFPSGEQETIGTTVQPEDLFCWWPRSGAYNSPHGAVYIARTNTRSMRKSAHPSEHYVVIWGTSVTDRVGMMLQLRNGASLVGLEFALRTLDEGLTQSIAISRDIILAMQNKRKRVIFRGVDAGIYEDGIFIPDHEESALARRVSTKMIEEGMI